MALPPSLNPREEMMKRRMKTEKKGKWLLLPILHRAKLFPHLVTSLAGNRGS
jgi:hypothetical protein